MPDDTNHFSLIDRIKATRVLCIGDVLLEHTVYGTIVGSGPEPVLRVDREARRVGGAGNILRHLATLGVAAAFVSVVGNDAAGREIERLLAAASDAETHLLVQPERTTTVKSRFLAGGRPMLRADRESAAPLGPYIRDDLLRLARELVTSRGAVIVADRGRGVLTDGVALEVIRAAQEAGARIVVDPEGGDPIRYRGADLLVASRRELAGATGLPVTGYQAVETAARTLINRCAFGAVLVAMARGTLLLVAADGEVARVASRPPGGEPGDAADAGGVDAAIVATVAAALGAGLSAAEALGLAGTVPGVAVGAAPG